MASATKPILITGATGKQGSAVLDALHSSNDFTLLAVTRNTSSASAQKLLSKYPEIKLVQGDLNEISALFDAAQTVLSENGAAKTIWGVYSVQISMGPGVTFENEVSQGKGIIDESIKRGVKHFVYSSVDRGGDEKSWDVETPIPHFQSKYQIERYLREQAGTKGEKMSWTVLRPVAFMENLVPGFPCKVFLAAMRDTMQEKPNQWVSTIDIGRYAGFAFTNPKHPRYHCKAVGIAGDELKFSELGQAFEKVTGSSAPATYGMFGKLLMYMVTEVNLMISWFASDGYGVNVRKLREEEGVMSFETWLREKSDFVKR